MGKAHKSKTNKTIPAKTFHGQISCCKLNCASKITLQRQQEIFSKYYNSYNWAVKTMFIRANIIQVAHASPNILNPIRLLHVRNYKYQYTFADEIGSRKVVCKKFFLNCLQITSSRVYRAISTTRINPDPKERRGCAPSARKTSEGDKKFLKEFINKFPRYKSHYGRTYTDREYLSPNLNISKMYREYELICSFELRPILSKHIFRETFNKEFNLAFKRPRIDTCKVCDELNIKLSDYTLSYEQRLVQQQNKDKHDETVREIKSEFLDDIDVASLSNEKMQCLTFDLQKTLETPSLSTSEFYYKRKLWTYNLCIYDEVHRTAFMYVWSENIASRGAQEIGSALKYHIENNIHENTKHMVLYSDACVSQNKNIKLTLLLKKILSNSRNLETITQKFFVSGHSYNSCDRCFGLIEKQKRVTSEIFAVEHWVELISRAKKNEPFFKVERMKSNMFFSTEQLEKRITNRKVDVNGIKINWHDIKQIVNRKNDPFSLEIK